MSADLSRLAAAVEHEVMARSGKERGGEIVFRCPMPGHEDKHPSAAYNREKMSWTCHACGAGGGLVKGEWPLAPLLGLEPENYQEDPVNSKPQRDLGFDEGTAWPIRDTDGTVVAVHHRKDLDDGSKKIWWSRDGEHGLGGKTPSELPLYGCHLLGEREPGDDMPIIVCEGEKATDAVLKLGLPAAGTVTGASSLPGPSALAVLRGRDVVLWPDADNAGQKHMERIAEALRDVAVRVRTFAPDGLPVGGDAVEWISATSADAGRLMEAIDSESVNAEVSPPSFSRIGESRYRFEVPAVAVVLEADYLRRESNQLKGELLVRCGLPGARTFDGVLSIGDFNFSSTRTRSMQAKYLSSRAKASDIDFTGLLEEFCQRILAAERDGEPAVLLADLPRPLPEERLDVDGLTLLERHPLIVFGDGGTAKSYLALYIAGQLSRRGIPVGYFDWELDGDDHRERLELLFGSEMPTIYYARCTRPFVYEAERLRRITKEHALKYLVFDSIAPACDGPPEAAEVASRYFQNLRQIGIVGSLHTAHVAKASENSHKRPFGSTFWHNLARATWNVQMAESSPGDPEVVIGLYNRKANLSGVRPSIGYQFSFAAERTWVKSVDVADFDDLAEKASTSERLRVALRGGHKTREQLRERLADVNPSTLRSTIIRLENAGKIVRWQDAAGMELLGLQEMAK